MSEQKEKSTKTKVKEFAYKAVSKVGHGIRKAGPYALMVIAAGVGAKHFGGGDDNSHKA